MNCFVTGASGFVGSHLCQRLVKEGHRVIGVDFPDKHYEMRNFEFIGADLCDMNYAPVLKDVDIVFHLAAEASVRDSWGEGFSRYLKNNIEATQKLLEVVKEVKVKKFIYASSFAVYDTFVNGAISETNPLLPYSPYGMTKLAAENLCFLYYKNYNVPTIVIRFFSIYGPGERFDTAFHRFMRAIAMGQSIQLYGDGRQSRDVTYIDDVIDAYLLAVERGKEGEAYNIGSGYETMLNDILSLLKDICGQKVNIKRMPKQKGDVLNVVANIEKAREHLRFSPKTTLAEGLEKEWQWIKGFYGIEA